MGTSISLVRGTTTSSAVQFDHEVALIDAWQKGAQLLSTEVRTEFANDARNLQSTDGPTNTQKGEETPPLGCRRTMVSGASTFP